MPYEWQRQVAAAAAISRVSTTNGYTRARLRTDRPISRNALDTDRKIPTTNTTFIADTRTTVPFSCTIIPAEKLPRRIQPPGPGDRRKKINIIVLLRYKYSRTRFLTTSSDYNTSYMNL